MQGRLYLACNNGKLGPGIHVDVNIPRIYRRMLLPRGSHHQKLAFLPQSKLVSSLSKVRDTHALSRPHDVKKKIKSSDHATFFTCFMVKF